jgi:hypothetical protein
VILPEVTRDSLLRSDIRCFVPLYDSERRPLLELVLSALYPARFRCIFFKDFPMRAATIFAVLCLFIGLPSLASACDGVEAQTGIQWCKDQCAVPHSNAQCDASGRMASFARNADALGVRNSFGDCQSGNDDDKLKQRANVESCFLTNQRELIARACNVYGCPASQPNPPPTPTPTPPAPVKIDFNQPMKPASDNKQIVVADFLLKSPLPAGQGEFASITLNYTRDDVNLFVLSTYAVNFDRESDSFHIKVTTYDVNVPDVSKHKYSVAGTLEISGP